MPDFRMCLRPAVRRLCTFSSPAEEYSKKLQVKTNESFHFAGHEIAEFFARTAAGQASNSILGDCHLQPQPASSQQEAPAPHEVVLDLGLNACVSKKVEKVNILSMI